MAKKTPREQIVSAMASMKHYMETITVGKTILAIPEVQKNDSTRVAQESLVRGAQENLLSEYNGIFRRVQEHVDGLVRDSETGKINFDLLGKFADAALKFQK